jgi:hypothetical protein
MDIVFGEPQKKDGEVWVSTRQGSGRPTFKQINGVKISELHEDTVVFNLQENDISSYDDDIRAAAKVNKQEWFGRDVSDRVLEKAYNTPTKDGQFTTQVSSRGVKSFSADKTSVPVGDLTEGLVCDIVVELQHLWFIKRGFGPEWSIVQIKLRPEPEPDPYDSYLFQEDQ